MGSYVGPNAFDQEGNTGRSQNVDVILNSEFPQTYVETTYDSSSFAGLDSTGEHLQDTPTADTSTIIVAASPTARILIREMGAMTTGGGDDMTGTVAIEGETDDIWRYTGTQYSQARFITPFLLPLNTALVHYRCDGNVGSETSDANIFCLSYQYVPAVAS